MPDLTTAQRLAAYRDELTAAGFAQREVWELVESVAPSLYEDLAIQVDTDGPTAKIGPISVYMLAKVDEESIAKAAEEIKWALQGAISEDGAPTNA